MATAWFSTNTELGLINALTQSLTVYLPNDAPQGKNLFVKDAAGNSPQSTITLTTQGLDTFENGSLIQTLNSAYESIQLNYNTNKWYITGGTMFNSMSVSTLQSQTIRATNLSSLNISVSSFQISDLPTSTLGTFNTLSSILYYNGNSVGGGLRTAALQTLNRTTFSPRNIQNLILWLDGADPFGNGTVPAQSTLMSNWIDKSNFKDDAFQTLVGNQPNYNTNGFINFNGSNAFFNLTDISFVVNTSFSGFIVEQRQTNTQNYIVNGLNINTRALDNLHIGYRANTAFTFAFWGNDLDTGVTGFTTLATEPFRIWSLIYTGSQRTIFLNGTSVATQAWTNNLNATASGRIGNNNFVSPFFYSGNIREIIFTKPSIDGFVRQQTEGYLAWKWGLQANLPASHPFRNAPPS